MKNLLYMEVNMSDLGHIYLLSTFLKSNRIKSISSVSPEVRDKLWKENGVSFRIASICQEMYQNSVKYVHLNSSRVFPT